MGQDLGREVHLGTARTVTLGADVGNQLMLRLEMPVTFEKAVEQATTALKAQGFGVLTAIDVRQTLKQKIDEHPASMRSS